MNPRLWLKNYLKNKRFSPFYFLPCLVLVDSARITYPMFLFFCIIMNIADGRGNWLIPLLIVSVLLCFISLVFIFLKQSHQLRKEKRDIVENNFIEVSAILVSSESLSKEQMLFSPNLIGDVFWKEAGVYQKFHFKVLNGDFVGDNYFYDFVTIEKVELLRRFFDAKISFWGLDVWMKEGVFQKELPLKLVIGKESHMLQKILPLEGYDYEMDEITAFEALSQRYFRTNPYPVCEKDRWYTLRIKRCERFVQKKVLPSRYILFKLFLYSVTKPLWFVASLVLICDILCFNRIFWLVYLCLIFGFYLGKRLSIPSLMLQGHDKNTGKTVVLDVVLKASLNPEEFQPSDSYAGEFTYRNCDDFWLLFKEEMASFQRCRYWKVGRFVNGVKYSNQDEFFHFVLTREKLAVMRCFYEITPEICSSSEKMPCFLYQSEVPLRITIGKKSKILYRIDPTEGYEYTETQLAAFEKFNTLYP